MKGLERLVMEIIRPPSKAERSLKCSISTLIIFDYSVSFVIFNALIKLIFLQSVSKTKTFWICMDATFFSMSRFKNFLHTDTTDEVRFVAIIIEYFSTEVYTSFHFSQTLPSRSNIRLIIFLTKNITIFKTK